MRNEKKDWDLLVLTVGNAQQKNISERLVYPVAGRFAREIRVLSDGDDGKRIGSAGAVLRAVSTLPDKPQKVLIVNSGGFSKRAAPYAVQGKAFADVEYESRQMTLLELILTQCRFLASQITSGVLICCSDICVMLRDCRIPANGNIGFCVRADVQTGTRHGVMFGDNTGRLTDYLHKQSEEKLRSVAHADTVNVDTGMIFLQDDTVRKLKSCAADIADCDGAELNFYDDIVSLFSEHINRSAYLGEAGSPTHAAIRNVFWTHLHDCSLRICTVESSDFLHFGTMDESRRNILRLARAQTVEINTYIDDESAVASGTVLSNVRLQNCTVGKNSMLCDISLHDTEIADNTCVYGMRLQAGDCVTVVCPISENPKQTVNGTALWDAPRFYQGKSFTQSYQKWVTKADEPTYSLADCTENADAQYPSDWAQYLRDRTLYQTNTAYHAYRERILADSIGTPRSRTDCVRRRVQIRLPVRVNLSGTWTDAMPYCIDNGGDVIHAAVTVDGKLPVCVAAERLPEPVLVFEDEGASVRYSADEWKSAPQMTEIGRFNLHLAALHVFGITPETEITDGLRLSTHVEALAPGSGLGVSSILLGGCFLALNRLFDAKLSMDEILHMVFVAEQKMQTGGGWQDQVGGLTAGLKRTISRPGFRQDLSIQPLPLSSETAAWFNQRLCLLHTGKRHFGRFIVHDVMHRYLDGDAQTLSGLETLKALNQEMATCISNGRTDEIAACLNRHFAALKQLSPRITDDEICHLEALCASVCSAVSICGAGGGGYFLVCLKDGRTAEDLRRFVRAHLPHLSADCVKTIALFNESYLISEEENAQ